MNFYGLRQICDNSKLKNRTKLHYIEELGKYECRKDVIFNLF